MCVSAIIIRKPNSKAAEEDACGIAARGVYLRACVHQCGGSCRFKVSNLQSKDALLQRVFFEARFRIYDSNFTTHAYSKCFCCFFTRACLYVRPGSL